MRSSAPRTREAPPGDDEILDQLRRDPGASAALSIRVWDLHEAIVALTEHAELVLGLGLTTD